MDENEINIDFTGTIKTERGSRNIYKVYITVIVKFCSVTNNIGSVGPVSVAGGTITQCS